MKKTFTFLFVLFLSIVIIGSCTKDKERYVATSKTELIKEAKKSYNDELLKQGLSPLNGDYNVRQAVSKTILWEKAQTKKISLGDAVIVPIQFEKELFIKQGEGELVSLSKLSYLMIYKDKKGESQQELVSNIPYKQAKSNNGNFVGMVIVEDLQGKFKKGYAYNEKGEIRKIHSEGTQIFRKVNNFRTISCTTFEIWGYSYWSGGSTDPYLISSETYCFNSGGGGSNEDQIPDHEEGGNSTGGTDYNPPQRDIRNTTTDPCISKTVEEALAASKNIQGKLSEIIKNFDANKSVIINVTDGQIFYKDQNGNFVLDNNGQKIPKPGETTNQQFIGNNFSAKITLGTDYHDGTSKENLTASLIHELVHAYLGYTSNNFLKTETDHNVIATKYVTPMANYLNLSFNIDLKDAYALAWSGVPDSKAWSDAALNFEFTMSDGNKITKQETLNLSGPYKLSTKIPGNSNYSKGTKICN